MLRLLKNSAKILTIFIGFSLMLVACQPSNIEGSNSITPTQIIDTISITVSPVTPINTVEGYTVQSSPQFTPSATSSSTLTPTETPVSIATDTLLLTNTPISPLPTLSPEEASEKVMTLFSDNQNPECLLPCLWGVIPGETYWQDIEPFLKTFALKIDKTSVAAAVKLPISQTAGVPGFGYYVSFKWVQNGVIDEIFLDSINVAGYDAKTMINIYGIPDEVWVRTLDAPYLGTLPFELLIVYQSHGFSLHYSIDATLKDDIVTACFEPGFIEIKNPDLFPASPQIFIWASGEFKSIDEIVQEPGAIYFPLEEKTDLTPETLYEKFANSGELSCIETPSEQWRIRN